MNYLTLTKEGRSEVAEKKSKFSGVAFPVITEREALEKIEAIKKKHFDARHNVYAFRLRENLYEKYSDDGEPSRTAGLPILEIIKKEGIFDICVVVTRYFGGILLGTGGLVRCYSQAALDAISNAGICKMVKYNTLRAEFDYSYYDKILNLIKVFNGSSSNEVFSDNVTVEISLLPEKESEFIKAVMGLTAGNINKIVNIGTKYKPMK